LNDLDSAHCDTISMKGKGIRSNRGREAFGREWLMMFLFRFTGVTTSYWWKTMREWKVCMLWMMLWGEMNTVMYSH